MNNIYDILDRITSFFKGEGRGGEGALAYARQTVSREGLPRTLTSLAVDTLCLAGLAISAVYCFITAFSLPLSMVSEPGKRPPHAGLIIPVLLMSAALCSTRIFIKKWKTSALLELLLFMVPNLLAAKKIYYSACTVVSIVTRDYAKVFGTPLLRPEGCDRNISALPLMLCIGLLLALLWKTAAVYGGFTGIDLTIIILLIAPCLVIKEHTPAPWAVVTLAASLCLIIMSGGAKRGSAAEGGVSAAKLLVPALLICLLPLFIEPPENYSAGQWIEKTVSAVSDMMERQAEKRESGESFFDTVNDIMEGNRFSVEAETESIDLSKAGPRRQQGKSVMNIRSGASGLTYLRGASLARYENSAWTALDAARTEDGAVLRASGALPGYTASVMDRAFYVQIQTDEEMNVVYTPYFFSGTGKVTDEDGEGNIGYAEFSVEDGNSFTVTADGGEGTVVFSGNGINGSFAIEGTEDGQIFVTEESGFESAADSYIENTGNYTDYSLLCMSPPGDIRELDSSAYTGSEGYGDYGEGGVYGEFVKQNYLYVPEDIKDELDRIAMGNGLFDYSEKDTPYAVADFVRKSARYDLNTPAPLKGEDFVLWFLGQSHSGYCVHFASAAAMLLRTVGIPSRYVTGYLVYADAGKWVHVTSDDAHAWVEYYADGVGWLPLEATAYSDGGGAVPTSSPEGDTTALTLPPTTATTAPPDDGDGEGTASGTDSTDPDGNGDKDGTAPDENGSGAGGEGEGDNGGGGARLFALLLLPAAAGIVYLRRYLELRRREALYTRSNGDCVLQLWTECEALLKKLGQEPDGAAVERAQRAAFSNHAIPKEDADGMRTYRRALVSRRQAGSNILQSLLDKYIYLLY